MKKNKILIFIYSFAAILSLSLFGFLVNHIFSKEAELTVLRQNVADLRSKKEELGNIAKNLGATLEDYELLRKLFVEAEGSVDFIESIEKTAKSAGLRFEVASVEAEDTEELGALGKDFLVLSINTVGNFKSNMQFIKLLENMPYKVTLSDIMLSKARENSQKIGEIEIKPGEWTMKLKVKVIRQKK